MKTDKFKKGRMTRFLKLGSLSSIVGTSYLSHKIKSIGADPEKVAKSLYKTNVKNAERITKTFGELKGAVMKVGQMMSLQSGILPNEFASELSKLQQDSQPIDFELIEEQITSELGGSLNELFREFDKNAYASASIGQVHKAVLTDGTDVVIKVQYPNVSQMVESDMKNLRLLFKSLGKMKLNMDVLELWVEVKERLTEELDYEFEMKNMLEFKALYENNPDVLIPSPVPEYSTKHVLTMEYLSGLNWRDVVIDSFPADTRNKLAALLFKTFSEQLFKFRTLHADPNLSNFAFREDGKLVLYDFGCVKRFPLNFVENYKKMVYFAFQKNYQAVYKYVDKLGFSWTPKDWLNEEMLELIIEIFLRPYLVPDTYDFSTATLHDELLEFGNEHFSDNVKFTVPPDVVFLDRVIGGMYGNMMQLKAKNNWKDILLKFIQP